MNNQSFEQAYNELEVRMRDLAQRNDEIYVPNIVPHGPVDYIFICMEPSLGEWTRKGDEAKRKLEAERKLKEGFRNFLDGFNTQILHYAIRKYLCRNDQRYHITDLSKGAMLTKKADEGRTARYMNWYPILLEEINLVASANAKVFAVGAVVEEFLERQNFRREVTRLIHYAWTAASHRDKAVKDHVEDFELFRGTVTNEDFFDDIKAFIESSGVPFVISERALRRLHCGNLTLSSLKLLFNYKLSLDAALCKANGSQVIRDHRSLF